MTDDEIRRNVGTGDDIHMGPANVVLGINVAECVNAAGTLAPMLKCTEVSERICRNDRLRVSDPAEAGQFGAMVRCGKAQHPGSSLPHNIENRDSEIKSTSTYPKHETGGGWVDARSIGLICLPVPIPTIGKDNIQGLGPIELPTAG